MNRLRHVWQLLRVMGPRWVLFRIAYALRQRTGWYAWRFPATTWESIPLASVVRPGPPAGAPGGFFLPRRPSVADDVFAAWDAGAGPVRDAARAKTGEFLYFQHEWVKAGRPPDWHRDPFSGDRVEATGHWSQLDEFGGGDIKLVWELNRFCFVFPLVRAYWRTGDDSLAECFWELVEDWCGHNPPQTGLNWKCGQEATFRAMAWCFGLKAFAGSPAQTSERTALMTRMLAVTGRRVAANLRYALSQQNNHSISEPAGLWTVGNLLPQLREASHWKATGRAALESQVRRLVYDDGGFSQHSVNYHRVMLEDCLWCIQIGRANGMEFSPGFVSRVRQAGQWLQSLMAPGTGRVPNWGSNDGAHVLPLTNCGYLDYRPVVQAASLVTSGRSAMPPGPWDELAWWLGCPISAAAPESPRTAPPDVARQDLPDSGLTVLRAGARRAVVRTVRRFRHRPAQCDLLHLDLWNGATNVLRDTGTYRYNSPGDLGAFFKSAASHNTVQFDGHDQMPVLGRFLLGEWPDGELQLPPDKPATLVGAYEDWHGCRHEREVALEAGRCLVLDRLSGFSREAVLRWHLCPDAAWTLDGLTCSSTLAAIHVRSHGTSSLKLVEGRESLFYNSLAPLQVLEIVLSPSVTDVRTEIVFS